MAVNMPSEHLRLSESHVCRLLPGCRREGDASTGCSFALCRIVRSSEGPFLSDNSHLRRP